MNRSLLFTFMPSEIDEFFSQIGQTLSAGWTDLGHQYEIRLVENPSPLKLYLPTPLLNLH
jgi:hypothetical protein